MNKTFHYSILRYRHSYLLQEEVNVGLLFFFDEDKRVEFLYPKSLQRISSLYHNFSVTLIKNYFKTFERAAKEVQKEFQSESEKLFSSELRSYINSRFLPDDASALYFTDLKQGNYSNVQKTLQYYKDQFLSEYEIQKKKDHKDERYILKRVTNILHDLPDSRQDIVKRDIKLETDLLSEKFDYAWKNGITNLITPVGFDLQHQESIKDKACTWQGKLSTLSEVADKEGYKFDIIVTRPTQKSLYKPYDQALRLIEKAGANQEIIEEDQLSSYSNRLL